MVTPGDKVLFSYVPSDQELPSSLDSNTIYFVEGSGQIYVGEALMANAVDLSEYQVKSIASIGEGNVVSKIELDSATGVLTIVYGDVDVSNIITKTTAQWNQDPTAISVANTLYVYSDHQVVDGKNVPGIKVGDGLAYIVDLPFTDEAYISHISDTSIHVTPEEKSSWNSKVRCYMSETDLDTLIFSTN